MKIKVIVFFLMISAFAQAQYLKKSCAIKLGGAYFINCGTLVAIKGQSVFNVTDADSLIKANFDVFDMTGYKIASVKDGAIIDGDKELFEITSTTDEYIFKEKSTKRIICYVKREKVKEQCELWLWADMYFPDGIVFQCTPDDTNISWIKMMNGARFENAKVGISLE